MVSTDAYNTCVGFPIFDVKSRSMKKAFLDATGGTIGRNDSNVVIIETLKDINIYLCEDDRVGLVGHNDTSKPMLLRPLSGTYEPTRGATDVRGRVASVFGFGAGMDPGISDLEDIIICGLFLGQTRKQMRSKFDEIAEFTELGDYLHMPLRTYSTGIRVRLVLSMITSAKLEILLLDEGIGAVDAIFMAKARTKLVELTDCFELLAFTSHPSEFLAQLYDTALWIDHGTARQAGFVDEMVEAYEGKEAADQVRRVLA